MIRDTPVEIHTGDRQSWRRCRRRFNWGSQLAMNFVREDLDSAPLWQGSGFHFGLEDFHGRRFWPEAADAFQAYVKATERERPVTWQDITAQTRGMLDYYQHDWLKRHALPFATLIVDGVPQVEVAVKIDITNLLTREARAAAGRRPVLYVTTFDRVVVDDEGRLWGVDYKTAKDFDYLNLETSPQAIAYDWTMWNYYDEFLVEGLFWQQHKKAVPVPPRRVNVGKKNEQFSTAEAQPTTWNIYRQTILDYYGDIPAKYEEYINWLALQEGELSDRFIRIDRLHRNDRQREAEQAHIADEVSEMLTFKDYPAYPNFTMNCSWDCPFKSPCLALDDGSDVDMLLEGYVQWQGYKDDWRNRVKYPERQQ